MPMSMPNTSILWCKLVTTFTVCFITVIRTINHGGKPSHRILSISYWFKMFRVNAQGITAEMVKLQTFGHFPFRPFVGHAVCKLCTSINVKVPISVRNSRLPNPATVRARFINLQPKPLLWSERPVQIAPRRVTMSQPAVVMNCAVTMSMHISNTIFNGTLFSHNSIITREHQWR